MIINKGCQWVCAVEVAGESFGGVLGEMYSILSLESGVTCVDNVQSNCQRHDFFVGNLGLAILGNEIVGVGRDLALGSAEIGEKVK